MQDTTKIKYCLDYVVINLDPIALRLGAFEIRWYGLAYVLAFSVGLWATLQYAVVLRVAREHVWRIFLWTAPVGAIGAHLYYVLQQPDLVEHYLKEPLNLITFWNGGLTAFGAIFLGFPTAAFVAWRSGLPLWLGLDMTAFFGAVAQPFGRLGNLANGDIVGYPAGHPVIPPNICPTAPCIASVADPHILPWATAYLHPGSFVMGLGVPYEPAAAYEIMFNMIALALLWPLRVFLPQRVRSGAFFTLYLAVYAVGQFIVFYTRSNVFVSFLGITTLKQAQWTALFTFPVILTIYLLVIRRFGQPWRGVQGGQRQPTFAGVLVAGLRAEYPDQTHGEVAPGEGDRQASPPQAGAG